MVYCTCPEAKNRFNFEVETIPPPHFEAPPKPIPGALTARQQWLLDSWWRIQQLALPKMPRHKFVREEPKDLPPPPELPDELKYRTNHLSLPYVRFLRQNRHEARERRDIVRYRNLKNKENVCWKSIYNFYKNYERLRELEKLERIGSKKSVRSKKSTRSPTKHQVVYLEKLAKPRKVFKPPPIVRKWKPLDEFYTLEDLAMPIVRPELPIREFYKISPAALRYMLTPETEALSEHPLRWFNIPEPVDPLYISEAALKYKPTPRVLELSVPKASRVNLDNTEVKDAFKIPKSALRYVATPRILELSKPIER